jgi:hypothetical protein
MIVRTATGFATVESDGSLVCTGCQEYVGDCDCARRGDPPDFDSNLITRETPSLEGFPYPQ